MYWIGAFAYLILIFVGLIIDDYILTKRHVKLFKQAMTEELRRLKAESLSTPGGEFQSVIPTLADKCKRENPSDFEKEYPF